MTTSPAKLSVVVSELGGRYSQVRTELESFDSGAEMLRIYCAESYFVMVYDGKGFWLDEPKEEDGLQSSFRHQFPDLGSASEALFRMISSGRRLAHAH